MNDELPIGSLLYDSEIEDYGVILDCSWTENYKPTYKYYIIYWQKSEMYNKNNKHFKWSAAHLHNRIKNGEVLHIN